MLSVSSANSADDFEVVAALCKELADWDVAMVQTYGVDPQLVMELYHGETAASLADRYAGPHAGMLLARWEGTPAGCLAFASFDDTSDELHKFYVAPAFRNRGIGRALMQAVVTHIDGGRKSRVLAHTTVYMADAIALYRSFDFEPCAPFREIPDSISHTEVFLSRVR